MDPARLITAYHRTRARIPRGQDSYVAGSERIRVNEDRIRAVFMYIHKCAGTSVINSIQAKPEVICCVARPGDFNGRTGRERIPDAIWERSARFTFVRNPFARVYSAYSMFRRGWMWRLLFPTFDDFAEFVRALDVKGHQVRREIPEPEYLRTIDTVIHHCSAFGNPKYHIDEMHFVGKMEAFEAALAGASEAAGVDLTGIPHLNRSGGGAAYRDRYSQKARDLIAETYAEDLDRFGYVF